MNGPGALDAPLDCTDSRPMSVGTLPSCATLMYSSKEKRFSAFMAFLEPSPKITDHRLTCHASQAPQAPHPLSVTRSQRPNLFKLQMSHESQGQR